MPESGQLSLPRDTHLLIIPMTMATTMDIATDMGIAMAMEAVWYGTRSPTRTPCPTTQLWDQVADTGSLRIPCFQSTMLFS